MNNYLSIIGFDHIADAKDYLQPYCEFNSEVNKYVHTTLTTINAMYDKIIETYVVIGYGTDYVALGFLTKNGDYYISNRFAQLQKVKKGLFSKLFIQVTAHY